MQRKKEKGGERERERARERKKEKKEREGNKAKEPLWASGPTAPLGSLARCESICVFAGREDSCWTPGWVFSLHKSHYFTLKWSKSVPLEKQLMESRSLCFFLQRLGWRGRLPGGWAESEQVQRSPLATQPLSSESGRPRMGCSEQIGYHQQTQGVNDWINSSLPGRTTFFVFFLNQLFI